MKKFALLSTVLAVLSTLFMATPANAWEPAGGATFNTPAPWGGYDARYRIIKKVEEAIARTPRGETILIASYFLDRDITADRLINACKRGVSVRVLLDSGVRDAPARRVIKALNADNRTGDGPKAGPCNTRTRTMARGQVQNLDQPLTRTQALNSVTTRLNTQWSWGQDKSYVYQCKAACRSGNGAMHDKFFAFSKTGSANNVIMVSSSNLNKGGASKGWNDMWTMKRRPASFAKYEAQHLAMTREQRASRSRNEFADGPFVSRFYPIIGAGKAKDPVLADLNRIKCWSGFGRTQVNVSMFWWGGKRGNWLADKLLSLGRNGCTVKIIVGAPTKEIIGKLRLAARRGVIQLWDSRKNYTGDSLPDVRTHMKSVMVRGAMGSNRKIRWVTTGSMNWTGGALTYSDENTLNITGDVAYAPYRKQWERIRNFSKRYR